MTRPRAMFLALILALASAAPASAAPAPSILQSGKTLQIVASSDVYTDHAGGIDAVWAVGDSLNGHFRFARRGKGRKAFGRAVTLSRPHGVQGMSGAHFYEYRGELRILFDGANNSTPYEWVAKSTNHGKTWRFQKLGGIAGGVFTGTPTAYGFFNREMVTTAANGSVFGLFGDNGAESLYTVSPGLTSGTSKSPFITSQLSNENIAREGNGAVWVSGRQDGGVGYRLPNGTDGTAAMGGGCAGGLTIPAANAMAVAHGRAVLAASFCGHLSTRSLTAGGRLGKLHRFGAASDNLNTVSAAYTGGRYRVAWVGTDGDVREASSANGSTWKVLPGSIPAAAGDPRNTTALFLDPKGKAGWVTWGVGSTGPFRYGAASAASRVGTPRASAKGIAHAKRGHLGTISLAGPGRLSLKKLIAGKSFSVRVVASAPDTVIVNASVALPTEVLGIGSVTVHLRAGHAKLLHFKADPNNASLYFRKGNKVQYSVQTRNGTLTVAGAKLVG